MSESLRSPSAPAAIPSRPGTVRLHSAAAPPTSETPFSSRTRVPRQLGYPGSAAHALCFDPSKSSHPGMDWETAPSIRSRADMAVVEPPRLCCRSILDFRVGPVVSCCHCGGGPSFGGNFGAHTVTSNFNFRQSPAQPPSRRTTKTPCGPPLAFDPDLREGGIGATPTSVEPRLSGEA